MLFNEFERKVIIRFYEKSKTKSKFWIWRNRPFIVERFELMKAERDFSKALKTHFIFKVLALITRQKFKAKT